MRRQTFFVGLARSPPPCVACLRAKPTQSRGLTPMPSPSISSPPSPASTMTTKEEQRLVRAVMEDFEREYKQSQEAR